MTIASSEWISEQKAFAGLTSEDQQLLKDSAQLLRFRLGQALPLQMGMSLQANIKLRKVSYLQLLFKTFKDKTDSLRKV
jgi:hypothetical protein